MTLLGRLSILGTAPPPAGTPIDTVLRLSRVERTYPVVCRNLGIPCDTERSIFARQQLARYQADEVLGRVDALALKGLHLAHRVYPSPSLRDMGDVDLLVRRSRLKEADAALRGLGYAPDQDPARLDGGSLHAVEYWREGSLPIHLHWHVLNASLPNYMVRIDLDELWRDARDGVLSPAHLVVTLCEHALKHSYAELIHLTDIDLASRGVDWDRVADAARRWGLENAVLYSLILLRDLMGVESPGLAAFRSVKPDWSGRAFLGLARRRRWTGLSALGLLSLTEDKARFVRESFLPPRREGFRTRTLLGRLREAAGRVAGAFTS
ncbi:MAG: nucleotidyltransferase family protein [Planctomycetaceae bacterium]|nr:nucleotidyltransferase family protein [Planctomycetaceae bacterium]